MQESTEKLAGHNSYKKLVLFSLPLIGMMIISSLYGAVDGIFVSNFIDDTAFAAVNFILPYLMILSAFGFTFGTGGGALIAKTLGEQDKPRANRYLSMFVYVLIGTGLLLTLVGELTVRNISVLMGASEEMLPICIRYGRVYILFNVFMTLQCAFQVFLTVAGKPNFAFIITVLSGVTNMVLDFFFVYLFRWDVEGAALATGMSMIVGGAVPLLYFCFKNGSGLRLCITRIEWRAIGRGAYNGLSEMCTNITFSVANMLYNTQLMYYIGQDGVTAYGVIMYVSFFFVGIFVGISAGISPIIAYNYGADDTLEIRNVLKKSLILIGSCSLVVTGLAQVFARPLSLIFVSYDEALLALTIRALRLYFLSFLFAGFGIFASSFFTSLSNGTISAIISVLRTFVFQVAFIYLLPLIWGVDGIWVALLFAELLGAIVSFSFILFNKKRYRY